MGEAYSHSLDPRLIEKHIKMSKPVDISARGLKSGVVAKSQQGWLL
jgi:hypothetical protein